jgi:hypothetical protein
MVAMPMHHNALNTGCLIFHAHNVPTKKIKACEGKWIKETLLLISNTQNPQEIEHRMDLAKWTQETLLLRDNGSCESLSWSTIVKSN